LLRCAAHLGDGLHSVPFTSWQVVAGPVLVKQDAGTGQAIEGPLALTLDGQALVLRAF